jgi:hypothetical protein
MNKPHKHAELIKAWADGAEIEYLHIGKEGWRPIHAKGWSWDYDFVVLYRIKPEVQPDIVKAFMLESHPLGGLRFYDATGFSREKDEQRILVTFDGETGELKDAKVLK